MVFDLWIMTKLVKHEIILIRYGEIGLKSKPIRRQFEKTLIRNIRNSLKTEKIEFEISKQRGRIYVHTEQIEKSIQILKKIFGITSISPCFRTDSSFNSMKKLTLNITRNKITKDDTFAIRSSRTGIHNFTSQDVAVFLGNCIVEKTNASVDLTNPDLSCFSPREQDILNMLATKYYDKTATQIGEETHLPRQPWHTTKITRGMNKQIDYLLCIDENSEVSWDEAKDNLSEFYGGVKNFRLTATKPAEN